MYRYDEFDHRFVHERVAQFRDQVQRRLSGALSEEEFKPLRLQNGVYLQLHAYMLRVAIPYGTLNSDQMRMLAVISEKWDKGYGHFTTRQNIQFNWPALTDIPDMLEALAHVSMHAIQTSGNCIRNVTADHFAGAAQDEVADPRPIAELIRQWSTDHPEFAFLPRKFKIAVTGSPQDRAVIKAHDIGIRLVKNTQGTLGAQVIVGGGLGRTPMIGQELRDFIAISELLPYLEAILRVYNRIGRRDNKYKARIKILAHEYGIDALRADVEAAFAAGHRGQTPDLHPQRIAQINSYFAAPAWRSDDSLTLYETRLATDPKFSAWVRQNTHAHRADHHAIVTISLKKPGQAPGDASADQMRAVANIAQRYGYDEIRVSHEQNLVLPHVHRADLPHVFQALQNADLATANIGLISDIIACPGMDYCALATARSIPIAQDIATHFSDPAYAQTIGEMKIKISGCINACGHHHVAHIGILGLEKAGRENYQITLGGNHTLDMAIGERAGRGLDAQDVVPAIERLVQAYLKLRLDHSETFLLTLKRLGTDPFVHAIYDQPEIEHVA